ncbi:PREDICTED: glutamate receptor ionotropic, kainate 2-like [Papilio polytes]|uniref:glutamate receptor ionotropic, kainate 2-like n=1 Tax=Papilio polytes TaxID=76194 RepID=UPI0006760CDA|nr:PREDICTED: glutamate receptor ionotropic, kainate 2-like [Papilio polytes]
MFINFLPLNIHKTLHIFICFLVSISKQGIVALIDVRPTNGICDISCLLCNKLHISHLSVGWQIPDTSDQDEFSFFYHPPSELISKAYATLIKELEWDRFTFFYEDDGSFIRLQEVINSWPYNNERIQFEKLEPDGDNRKTFKNVFGVLRISYHLIDCDVKNIQKYMKEIVSIETALTADALNHFEKAIRIMRQENMMEYVDPPEICFAENKAAYKEKAWIHETLFQNAEMAISDITITSERSAVVEFSMPFMSLGISMLVRERDPQEPDMFSFIKPLALDVWLYLATAYIIVSFVLLICARMSQGDWVNPHPCNQHPENLQNIWSLYNCMWLTVGSIMTQGCDILPRAAGSRWVTGMWWFFALIVTASYTANMSTFLSNSRRDNDIKDIKELSEQNEVSYGVLINGSTYNFFENSNDSVYQKIWTVMKSAKPTVFTNNNDEGRDRVVRSKGNYVFFMESTAIEYYMQRNCDLKMVGSKLDSKDYGIVLHKNSPYKRLVDNAILALQETGDLLTTKKKWWESDVKEGNCEKSTNEAEDNGSLQMKNTSGIFLVLGFGGILGFFVAIINFLLHARQISVKEKVRFIFIISNLLLYLNSNKGYWRRMNINIMK